MKQTYVHEIPGRLRVKSPLLKGDRGATRRVRPLLENAEGVLEVTANELTGSIVVLYDASRTTGRKFLDILGAEGLFDPGRTVDNDQVVHHAVSRAGKKVRRAALGLGLSLAMESAGLGFLAVLI